MTSPVTLERSLHLPQPDDDPAFLRGPVLRGMLAVLGALLVCLAGVLTLAALGVAITRGSTLVAVGGYAVAVLTIVVLGCRRGPRASRQLVPWRRFAGGLATGLVLVASIAVAQALQPTPVERLVALQSTEAAAYGDGVVSVRAGEKAELGWQLRGYGVELTASPVVVVTLDATVPDGLEVVSAAPSTAGSIDSTSQLSGSVTFTAPARPGRHDVVIRVSDPADPAGGQQLTLQLQVRP